MRGSKQSIRLKGLKRYSNAGKSYCYHRTTGIALPSHLPENHPEFIAAYIEAEKVGKSAKPRKNGPGSIEAACTGYLRSDAHKTLSTSYKRVRQRDLAKLVEIAGHVPIRTIKPDHIKKDMADLEPHPANERLKSWRAVCKYSVEAFDLGSDPSEFVKRRIPAKPKPHKPWTRDDKDAFRTVWEIGTPERLAMEILNWTGARMSDAVRFSDGMIDREGWLNFTQKKTGGDVSVPVHRNLPKFADPCELAYLLECLDARTERPLWITTAYGTSRSEKAASQWLAAKARKAGLIGKTGHGLRKTRAIELAENRATVHQIGAWTGHESLKEIEAYSRNADRKRLLSSTESERFVSKAKG